MPFLVAAFLAGADFLTAFAETAFVAAGFAAGADLALAFAGAAFTETALVALAKTGLDFEVLVVVDLVAVAFVAVFAPDLALGDFDFCATLDPPKAAAQPSV